MLQGKTWGLPPFSPLVDLCLHSLGHILARVPTYFTCSLFSTRGCVDMMREIPFHGVFHIWITHGDNLPLQLQLGQCT